MGTKPHTRDWSELTWNWVFSTGDPTSDQKLGTAADAGWPYAKLCAWTYLNDHAAAHDIMDHAVENTSAYLTRNVNCPDWKLLSHLKSSIRRRAQQESAKRKREIQFGSLTDLEALCFSKPSAEQRIYALELFARLSPFSQSIVRWRALGFSWRKIAGELEMDHTAVRRAYIREVETLLHDLSQSGDLSK